MDLAIESRELAEPSDDKLMVRFWQSAIQRYSRIEQPDHWRIRDLHTNASGDFILLSRKYWNLVGGFPADDSVLCLDGDSIVMHTAAALGAREICFPVNCVVFKPWHDHLSNLRLSYEWKPWQRVVDAVLTRTLGYGAAFYPRMWFDYPRRKLRGIESVVGPSIERNFVAQARRWARGHQPKPRRQDWGLANEVLPESVLCRASWDRDLEREPA